MSKRRRRKTVTPKNIRDILAKSMAQIMDAKGWGPERRIEKDIELATARKRIPIMGKDGKVAKYVYEPLYQIQGPAIDRMHKLAADYPAEKKEHSITGPITVGWEHE